jgi:threonyl-tRNA synthetase
MRQIVQGKHDFKKTVISAEEAKKIFADQPYKLELIEGLEKGGTGRVRQSARRRSPTSRIYQQDTFTDLCRGPHVENTKRSNRMPSS